MICYIKKCPCFIFLLLLLKCNFVFVRIYMCPKFISWPNMPDLDISRIPKDGQMKRDTISPFFPFFQNSDLIFCVALFLSIAIFFRTVKRRGQGGRGGDG